MSDPKLIKELSIYMKVNGEKKEKRWRYLVDLNRLSDYLEPKDESEFEKDVIDWVQRDVLHTWDGDEEKWYSIFEEEVKKVFSSGKMPEKILSVDDFLQNYDLWATTGSAYDSDVSVKFTAYDNLRNRTLTAKKTKWSTAWTLGLSKLKKIFYKKKKQINKAMIKSEPAKQRAVIAGDLTLYLKQAYISQYLDQAFKGSKLSTLWMNKQQNFELWQSMAFDGTWRMPLDQDEFDKNVSLRQVQIINSCIYEWLQSILAPESTLEIMRLIIYAMDGGYVFVNNKSIPVTNGILSGWRWTAFLDTIVNICEKNMAVRWASSHGLNSEPIDFCAQGDDDWFKFSEYRQALMIWLAYYSFGLKVNPNKFFISTTRDEFLRRVFDKNIITGYPARSVTALLFRNPIEEVETRGPERVRQVLTKWKLFSERLDTNFFHGPFLPCWYRDCIQSDRSLSRSILSQWLSTSVHLGGIGYDGAKHSLLYPHSELNREPSVTFDSIGVNDYRNFVHKFDIDDYTLDKFILSTLSFSRDHKLPPDLEYIISPHEVATNLKVIRHPIPQCNYVNTVALFQPVSGFRFFHDYHDLKTFSVERAYTWQKPESTYIPSFLQSRTRIISPLNRKIFPPFTMRENISMNVLSLATDFRLVFSDYSPALINNLPKSWAIDWLKGRLKAKLSPRPYWGMDIVGYIGETLLNSAILDFLSTHRPSIRKWKDLLICIDETVPKVLSKLLIRVVE
jgi:hypothetical protein